MKRSVALYPMTLMSSAIILSQTLGLLQTKLPLKGAYFLVVDPCTFLKRISLIVSFDCISY